ncbi:MAG: aldo/keto reductase family protein [Actinomycetota bacterium]|nr:aldo/keto reductase family protein [Actinomycetota bacterium]
MEYRNLGGAGVRVSEIALGNWITHGGQVGDDAARSCVEAALDEGINFFDTADVYAGGRAEAVLGGILKGVRRSSYVLATKVFWSTGNTVNDQGLSRKHIIESCHASLKRLQTDYVDLYQAHRFDTEVRLEETLRAFEDLVRGGKALYIGISEWTAEQISEALTIADEMGFDRIVSSQPQYSILWRVPEAEIMPLCRREGIGQICWSPLAMGVLTGKYKPGEARPEGSRAAHGSGIDRDYLSDETLTAVQNLRPVADELGVSMATLALAWVLHNDNVAAAIVGATKPEQVRENVKASGLKLDDQIVKQIDEILAGVIVTDPSLTGG